VSDLDCGAGMIADPVKCRGRSRHGYLAAAAMTVARASGRQHTPTACSGRELCIAHLLAPADRKREGRLARIRSPRNISREGEHPALGPVPLARCHVFGFASLRTGFAAAPNLRPRTSAAVMAPSYSTRT